MRKKTKRLLNFGWISVIVAFFVPLAIAAAVALASSGGNATNSVYGTTGTTKINCSANAPVLVPTHGPAGQGVSLSGSYSLTGTQLDAVVIQLDGTDQGEAGGGSGSYSGSVTIPENAAPGSTHTIDVKLIGTGCGVGPTSTFTVDAQNPGAGGDQYSGQTTTPATQTPVSTPVTTSAAAATHTAPAAATSLPHTGIEPNQLAAGLSGLGLIGTGVFTGFIWRRRR